MSPVLREGGPEEMVCLLGLEAGMGASWADPEGLGGSMGTDQRPALAYACMAGAH